MKTLKNPFSPLIPPKGGTHYEHEFFELKHSSKVRVV